MTRFSKKALAEHIRLRLTHFDFDRGNGWSQVVGKGESLNRDYGHFRELLNIADEFELDLSHEVES